MARRKYSRSGPRNGTGPRSKTGNCPKTNNKRTPQKACGGRTKRR